MDMDLNFDIDFGFDLADIQLDLDWVNVAASDGLLSRFFNSFFCFLFYRIQMTLAR